MKGILAVLLLTAVFLGYASCQNPQPNVLSGLNFQAVGATIFLRPEVFLNASLASHAKQVTASFSYFSSQMQQMVPDANLNAGIGFSATLWSQWGSFLPMPQGLFDFPGYTGPTGWPTMVRSGGELFIHGKAARRDALYNLVNNFVASLGHDVVLYVDVIESWQNKIDGQNRDLTGYVDGSVNVPPELKTSMGLIGAEDKYHVNGSFAIAQRWVHDLTSFLAQNESAQDDVFGRTKADSKELPNPLPTAHFVRVQQSRFGYFLVRQAMPWGDAMLRKSGLFFIAYTKDAHRLDLMCRSMVGHATDFTPEGPVDDIMRFSVAVASNFWYFPSQELLASLPEH